MLLENRVAVITGAASARGIGKAMAQVFAEHGARVAILDLNAEAAAAAAKEIGPDHLGLDCNVINKSDCERATQAAAEGGAGFPFPRPAPLGDAGARADPLVARVHHRGEVVVGDDMVGHGEPGAQDAGARHGTPGKAVRREDRYCLVPIRFPQVSLS